MINVIFKYSGNFNDFVNDEGSTISISPTPIYEMIQGCYMAVFNSLDEYEAQVEILATKGSIELVGIWNKQGEQINLDKDLYNSLLVDGENKQVGNFSGWSNRNLE